MYYKLPRQSKPKAAFGKIPDWRLDSSFGGDSKSGALPHWAAFSAQCNIFKFCEQLTENPKPLALPEC